MKKGVAGSNANKKGPTRRQKNHHHQDHDQKDFERIKYVDLSSVFDEKYLRLNQL